jgi:hypothetical protein
MDSLKFEVNRDGTSWKTQFRPKRIVSSAGGRSRAK